MLAVDVLYWAALLLGASYIVLSLAIGGLSHAIQSVHGTLHLGGDAGGAIDTGSADLGHVDAGAGEMGHVDFGHTDAGHLDLGHADAGAADFGHADASSVGVGDAGALDAHVGMESADGIHADGSVDHAAHSSGHGHDTSGGHGPGHGSPFSLLALLNPTMASSFLIGFGGGGVLSRVSGAGVIPSVACAGVGGSLLYYYVWWIIVRLFGGAQASSHTRRAELVGARGTVIAAIEGTRPGMIAITLGGSRQTFRAITYDNDVLPVGSPVRIRRVLRDSVMVTGAGGIADVTRGVPTPSSEELRSQGAAKGD